MHEARDLKKVMSVFRDWQLLRRRNPKVSELQVVFGQLVVQARKGSRGDEPHNFGQVNPWKGKP
jgi:hypothetical protein